MTSATTATPRPETNISESVTYWKLRDGRCVRRTVMKNGNVQDEPVWASDVRVKEGGITKNREVELELRRDPPLTQPLL